MKTKNIFKTVALAMLMPAMLLTTACSNQDDIANTSNITSKGYALPVTVNVTRGGDATTRATFDGSKLNFSDGDKLFVNGGSVSVGSFAGTLTWQSGGTFSGTIYTSKKWDDTADELFATAIANSGYTNATLLPNGYGSYGYLSIHNNNTYDDYVETNETYTCATSKADGVAQFSYEKATTYSSGFALAPQNAILNFTITGLAASTSVNVSLTSTAPYNITGTVTTDAFGTATFAAGVEANTDLSDLSLTVDGNAITLVNESKTLTAGKIYNITRSAIPGALFGQFSVSSTDKVYFSKGNLQYTKSTGIWSFMDHQYSTVETTSQAIGTDYADQDVVSLFGWGTSGWNNGNTYYQPYNTAYVSSSGSSKGYGYGPKNGSTYTYDLTGTYANADWGHNAISNGGNTADTWRTLTEDEWTYLFNTRSASTVNGTADARYAKAYLFGTTHGVIIFPDVYTHPAGVTAPTGINETNYTRWDGNRYTTTDWAKMEAAGCVFLPAAGWRDATTIRRVNEYVRYWTSTYYNAGFAYNVGIAESSMNPADYNQKNYGYSVRLVHDAN